MNRRIWLILICIFSILPCFGQSLPSYVPTNGLVGWWPFDGNANDISGNGNHGSAVGASLTADRHGLPNNAYDFDGLNDYILVPGSGIPVDGKTYSVWVNADVLTNNSRSIIEHGAPSSSRWALRVMNNQIESAYGIGCSGNTTAAQSTNDMTANDWKHIAVRDNGGNTLEIFLNGTLVSTQSVNNQGTNCSTAGLYFGVDIFSVAEFFNGKLDDIGVWNRSLTNEEIAQLYSSTIQCSDITINHSDTTICYGDTVSLYADYFDDANYTYIGSSSTSDYYIDNSNTGWTNSRNAALAAGADLVVIEDAAEQQLLDSIVYAASLNISGYKGFHIGYYQDLQSSNYSEPNGGWTWVNGSSTFTNWAASEPSNSGPCQGEHWAMMYDNGSWNDECDGIWDGNDLRGIIEVPKNKALSNFAWSTGSSNSSINIYPTQETTYWITSVENGSTCRDTITVKVNDARVSYSTLQLCENENDSALLYLSTPSIDTYTPLDSISQAITSNWSKQMTTVPGEQYILEVGGLFTYGTYCPNLVNDPAYQLAGYYGLTSPNPRNIGSSVGGLYVLGQAIGRPTPDVYNGTTHTYTYPFTASGNSITVGWYDAGPSDNCGTISFRLLKVNQNAIWSTGKVSDSLWVNPSVTSSYWVAKTENGTTCTTSTSIEVLTSSILNQDTTICAGETMIIKTIDGKVGVWSTGQTASQITVTPTQNTTYWVAPYANGVICYDTINVTVNPIPAAPTWDPANITEYCKGDPSPVELTATTLSGHTVNWYGPSGSLLTTSAARTPSTNSAGNTIYRVTQTNSNGCESPALIIMVTVHDLPTAPSTSNSTIQYCQNETATALTAIASSGHTLVWYDTDGTTVLVSAPIPSTSNVGTTTYYVAQKNAATDCEGPKSSITVSVNITPSPPTATTTYNYCPGDVASALSATASVGHTLIWYNSNGSIITTGAPTPYTGAVGTTNYFVSQQNSLGCESVAQIITVNVDPTPSAPTVSTTSFTYCKGDIATALTATPSSGHTLVWYDSDASTVLSSAVVPQTTTPGTKTYYVAQENANGCESPLVSITVTVNPLPSAPLASSTVSYCTNDVATTLTATASSGHTLVWYNTNGTTILSGAPTPYTAFAGTTTYYVSQVNANGCEGPLTPITVTVQSSPSAPITNTTVDYCQGATASVLSATITSGSNNTLVWYDSDASTVLSSAPTPQTVVSGSKTYYVAQQNSIGCESPLQAITVSVNPIPTAPTVNPSNVTLYCLNDPSPSELVAIASIGHTLTWYDASNNILSTSLLRTPSTGLAGKTTYRVTQSNNSGCESAALNIDITVNPLPTISVVEGLNQYTCIGSPVTLTGTGAGTNGTYSWSGGIVNGASFTPTNNASYTLTGTDQNGCSASATANITLAPGSIENNDTTLCYGESLTLKCINNQVGIWSTGDTASQITVTPTQNTTYWVAPFTNGVNCSDTVTISVINSNIITADSLFCESPDSVLLHTTVANLSTTESIPYGLINANGIYVSNSGSDVNGTGTQSNPYKTIQKGINESSSNGSVIVLPGTYKGVGNVNLSLLGKNIVLQSMTGPDNTIIDGENLSPGFILNSAETISTIIRGFTLQNCVTTSKTGSAIFVEDNSGITVRSCIFKSNSLLNTTNGSVIQLGDNETSGPSSQVDSCIFYNNTMAVLGSSKKSWRMSFCLIQGNTNTGNLIGNGHDAGNDQEIEYCVFRNNTTTSGPIVGLGHAKTLRESFFINNTTNSVGAIYLGTVWSGTNIVDHCTFYNHDGTVYSSNWYDHIGNVTNCIFYGSTGLETISGNQNSITFTYSNGNLPPGTGNTSGNPLFSNPSNNDFTLSPNSPCIGTGSNSSNQGADPSNIPEWLWTFTASSNSLLWSIGDSNDSIWTKPTQTTIYWVEQSLNGTTCSDSITISVNQGIQASDTTICYGENVTLSTVSGQSAIWSTGDTATTITVNPATTTKYWATTSYVGGTCSDTLTVFVNAPSIHGQTHSCNSNDSLLLWTTNTSTSTPNSVLPQCNSITGSLKNGLVAYYPFCGNAHDLSNNGNHGVVNGASLTSDRFGKPNSAYIFDGINDFIEIANSTSLSQSNTNGLTLSCWIKHDQVWQNPKWLYVISKTDGTIQNGDGGYILRAGADGGAPFGYVPVFKTINGGNQFSSINPITDVWEHLCLTYNNDTARFYRDGVLVKEYLSGSAALKANTRDLILGASVSNSNYFKGILDEVGIWNRALSQDEIAQLMNTGTGAVSTQWSTGQTNDSIRVNPNQTTTYWVNQTLNGKSCSDSVTIIVNQGIQASDTTICYGNTVTLSTVSGQSAIWSTGDTATTITVNPATTTKYWATTSYVGGTCSDTLTVFVNAPKINSNDLYSCAPQDSVLLYNSNHLNSACSPLVGSIALNSNGWYPFCGNSEDLSPNQNVAFVDGAILTNGRSGGTNSAYYFDGVDDYLMIFDGASNNYGTSSISMAAWVKIPTVSNPQQAPIIGNYISTTTAAFNLMVGGANELNPGKLNFFARNSSGAEMNLWSTTRIDDDQWHHVAIVRNSTNDSAFLYIDGTLNRKSAIASGSFDSFQGFVIGGAHLNRYLKCTIDEIATWRRALSSSEIHQLATQAPSISNWSTGQSTDSIWVKPTQTTTYWIEQSLNGVTCTDSATVFINKVNIEPSLPTICTPGDSVLLYAPGVEQGFDEPNCNSGYVGLRPTYTPGESINGYSYKGMYNGHHYYLANSPGSWTDAAAAAKIAGGHLVCIDDVNEQNFVANLSTGNLWLGYYRTPTNAWAWVNCQTSNYTNWRSGEPGTSEPYAHIITDNCSYNGGANQWNDIGNLSNNGVCYSNCYGVLEIDPDEIGFGQNSQVLSWSNGASNDSIWLTPNQDGDYWLTSYVNGEGCSDTVSLRVLNPAITAPTTTSCSPGDSVMLYYSGNREFAGLDTIAVPDQLIGQVTKSMTVQWTQSWNVTPNQTYIVKASGLYSICCGTTGCLDPAYKTLNCYSPSQIGPSNPCNDIAWWKFNDDCTRRPDNDSYNNNHEYYYTFVNTDGTVDLSFFDNAGDNSGSLTFTLYSTKQKVVRTYNDTITWSTGETSDTIWVTPTTTSTYSVTASRGGVNCLDSIQIDVTTLSNFDPLIPTRIHCEATNTVLDGTDTIAITYSWSTGAQTSSTTVNTSGQYWVQATDNLGCSFSDTTQVWLSNIQSNLSSIEPTCYGFSNGSITPNASGGISSYSYLWSNGDTTAALSATASGLYWVTITDSVGCSVQDSILLDEPADLTVTASATSNYNGYNIPCFGGLNGQANAVVSGGTLPYTYSWSNGSPDSIVYSLAAGTHTVNIMDSNGCITSDTVLITQPTGINTSLSSTSSYNGFDISCYGVQDGSIQLAVSGGVTPYQHYWSNGANGTSVSNIGAGLYTVNTVDANGCSSVDSITLNQPTVLTSTATIVSNYNGYNVSCYGASDGSAQISALGGNAPYTYSWSNGTTSNQNNGISAGSYSVTVTDTNGCTVQNSVVLNEPTELQISTSVTSNFNGYPISCTGANDGSALVNSNGGTAPYTILWSNGDTSLTTNNLSAGTYFVTVTDANGCSKSDSVVLTDPIGLSNLTLSASSYNGFNISCNGGNDGTISMTGVNGGTAPLSYYWNTGDSTSSITSLPAGNYTLTVTDVNGCSISDSLTLDQPTLLTSNAYVTSNFNGTNISCNGATDGSAQVSGAGGVGPYIFLWNTSDTSTTIANLSAGTYTVLVTDANGCSTTDTVSLTEPSLFSITAGVQSNYNGYNISCAGGANGQVAALAIGGTGPYNYTWSNGTSSPGQSNLAAGMYIINVSDANGCSAADTLTLIDPPALSSIASVTSNYNGYNVSCQGAQDGSATVNAQGGVTPYSINWSNGSSGATVSNLSAGVHTVTIQDANGCSTNESVNLTEPGGVSVTATSSSTTCYGADDGSATLTVSGGTGNFDIQWSNGGTGLNQTGLASNWYSYTISTSPNCFLTDSIWVDQPEPLVIQVDTVPPTCISAFDGEINVVAFGGTPGYQYFLNGTAFSGFQDELGTDSLEIVAVDMNNCDTTLILAMPAQTQSCLFIPNWFTPNGNNQEDAWRIEGFEYENLRLKVFNVMGQLIYTTESSTYIPWDGNYNGSPLPEGDYYYLIESTVNDSKYSGYVTLLR